MRLTVLGKSPSWQDVDGACSGYLIEDSGASLLLDCGNGVFAKLRQHRDYTELDAVLISHLHADHILDLVPYAYALADAPRQEPVPVPPWPGTDHPARPELDAPRGAVETFRRLCSAWGGREARRPHPHLGRARPHLGAKAGLRGLRLPGRGGSGGFDFPRVGPLRRPGGDAGGLWLGAGGEVAPP